jgi:hypothetical protein
MVQAGWGGSGTHGGEYKNAEGGVESTTPKEKGRGAAAFL